MTISLPIDIWSKNAIEIIPPVRPFFGSQDEHRAVEQVDLAAPLCDILNELVDVGHLADRPIHLREDYNDLLRRECEHELGCDFRRCLLELLKAKHVRSNVLHCIFAHLLLEKCSSLVGCGVLVEDLIK